ncbi:MAG: zinc ABC transporter substrate-binding protein [Rhodospirillaceae bacterium]|nr:zinc ABC transporter substrate-binding protein [Rhodospirillaceae bacterium]
MSTNLSRRAALAVLPAGLLLATRQATARAALDAVATTPDLAAIARQIGGAAVKADSLASGVADPHFIAAKPSMIRRTHDADLLISVGAELEIGWLPVVVSAAANPKINLGQPGNLDISGFVSIMREPGPASRAQGDVHKAGNPHYMLDPRNGLLAARAIAGRMSELDAGNAATYRANLTAFEDRFRRKWGEWQSGFAPLRGQRLVSYHRSLPYLARAFGFEVVGEVEPLPGISPTASHLEQLMGIIRRDKVRLLLMEGFYERRSAAFLAAKTGIKVAVIPHSVDFDAGMKTYFDLFDGILKAIRAAGAL